MEVFSAILNALGSLELAWSGEPSAERYNRASRLTLSPLGRGSPRFAAG